jgi:hypothetical protein
MESSFSSIAGGWTRVSSFLSPASSQVSAHQRRNLPVAGRLLAQRFLNPERAAAGHHHPILGKLISGFVGL